MKTDFSLVMFSADCKALLDGPEVMFFMERVKQSELEDNMGRGGTIFCVIILGSQMINPFKIDYDIKINTANCPALLSPAAF